MLADKLSLSDVDLTDSAAWYIEKFKVCGDWQSWIWETVTGKDYDSRRPHFDGFLVCEKELGRANSKIAELAISNGKPVLFCRKGEPLSRVDSVEEVNREDWQRGWKVRLEGGIK